MIGTGAKFYPRADLPLKSTFVIDSRYSTEFMRNPLALLINSSYSFPMRPSGIFPLSFAVMLVCYGQPGSPVVVDISAAFARQGIEVTTAADAAFRGKLEGLVGKDVVAQLGPVVPYLMILTNHSSNAVTRVTAAYIRISSAGRTVHGWSELGTSSGNSSALAPGATLIDAPRNDLSKILFSLSINPMNVSIANISNQLYTGLFDSRRFTSTTLSLDSVIFKNGGVVGPDRFDAIGKAAAGTKAWSELMAKVNDTSVSDNDLNTWLQQLASQPARNTVGADGAINHYLTAQIAFSRFLLDRVNKSGRADLTRNTPASPVSGEPQLFHLDQ